MRCALRARSVGHVHDHGNAGPDANVTAAVATRSGVAASAVPSLIGTAEVGWASKGGGTPARAASGLLLGLEHLAAAVHAGLEIDMVRPAQLARILVLDVGRLRQGVGGAAHAAPRRRCFSFRDGHGCCSNSGACCESARGESRAYRGSRGRRPAAHPPPARPLKALIVADFSHMPRARPGPRRGPRRGRRGTAGPGVWALRRGGSGSTAASSAASRAVIARTGLLKA